MDASTQVAPHETELLSWSEICAQYPDQYVCLVDVEAVELGSPEIKAGRIVGRGATRRAAYEPIRGLGAKFPLHSIRFTGICTETFVRPSLVIDDETLELLRS